MLAQFCCPPVSQLFTVAGLIAARLENLALAEAAQLATAFAAAKLTRLGPHLPPPEEVRALAQQITVTSLD